MTASPFPVLRLKPKADARRIRHGHPWVFADDIVADRRTRAIPPGTVAVLEDAERTPLAAVAATMESRIAARVLDHDARIAEVNVRVHKPHAPLPGVVRDVVAELVRRR